MVRALQSLAQTGDLNAPVLTLLLGVAFAGIGAAVLYASKRRRENDM
ncbi:MULTISPECIES: LPXTG cell wall anchor domain-containing protein [unclassified Adlercreutzia]|nr:MULTISPECIES: LPXTG cell wall anchor domain-containing protein [unclassified Adlercreutzia]